MREYERFTTTSINAYVQPMVDRYLKGIESGLAQQGFGGDLYITSSNAGTVTAATARRFPVRIMESGPAAGALMATHVGAMLGLPNLLSYDTGGTTSKGCLILDGKLPKAYELETARVHEFKKGSGLTVKTPVADMIEIGAGGGSIAEIDERGLLRVGPQSAGADPGPACYGRGGEEATLTDADLVLGYLDAEFFLGGSMRLDLEASKRIIMEHVGYPLGLELTEAAWGIHETINENCARAFRMHASEQMVDYRNCTMVAFGGSAPIRAVRVARKLKIPRVVLPMGAGVFSAFGLLISPLAFDALRTHRVSLDELTPTRFADEFRSPTAEDPGLSPASRGGGVRDSPHAKPGHALPGAGFRDRGPAPRCVGSRRSVRSYSGALLPGIREGLLLELQRAAGGDRQLEGRGERADPGDRRGLSSPRGGLRGVRAERRAADVRLG